MVLVLGLRHGIYNPIDVRVNTRREEMRERILHLSEGNINGLVF